MSVPQVTDGSNLPGAFLFVTYTPKNNKVNGGKKWSGVAYDPYAQDGDTLQQLIARYKPLNKLPYYELFTPMDQTKDNLANWNEQGKTYMGVFGQNAGPFAPGNTWPYAGEANSAIRTGVFISYWNKKDGRGLETNGANTCFDTSAETSYMSLASGGSKDLLAAAGIPSTTFAAIKLEWYAMKRGWKLNI